MIIRNSGLHRTSYLNVAGVSLIRSEALDPDRRLSRRMIEKALIDEKNGDRLGIFDSIHWERKKELRGLWVRIVCMTASYKGPPCGHVGFISLYYAWVDRRINPMEVTMFGYVEVHSVLHYSALLRMFTNERINLLIL
jgi:hypothetical protein